MTMAAALVEEDVGTLRKAAVFRRLGEDELKPLLLVAERRCFARGEMILPRSDVDESIVVVIRGGVRLYLSSTRGRELTLYRRRMGDVFELSGEAFDPGSDGQDPAEEIVAEALEDDTVVYVIPWLRFLSSAASGPDALSDLARLLREQRKEERAVVREQTFFERKARLAHKLAELVPAGANQVVEETREALGSMTGAWPEDVTKALHQLRDEGLVDFEPHKQRRILILDVARLALYGK